MNTKQVLYFFLFLIIFLPVVIATYPLITIPMNSSSDFQPNAYYEYNFTFASGADCSSPVLALNLSTTLDEHGRGFLYLDISTLTTVPKCMMEYRNQSNRYNHSFQDGIFNNLFVQSVISDDWSNVSITEAQVIDLSYNTTAQMISAVNTTNLLINWTGKGDTYNTTAQMILAVNTTNLLINWTGKGDTYNTTAQMISAVNTTGLLRNWTQMPGDINMSDYCIRFNGNFSIGNNC